VPAFLLLDFLRPSVLIPEEILPIMKEPCWRIRTSPTALESEQEKEMKVVSKLLVTFWPRIARRPYERGPLTEFMPAERSDYPILNNRYIAFERAVVSFLRKQDIIEPNHITYFRFAVCLPLLLYSSRLSYLSILILVILGGLSDFFDGAFARSASKKTRLGTLIDPLADKALIFTTIYILIMKKALDPLYVFLIAIMETHLIIAPLLSWFYGLLRRRSHRIPYSTSKVNKTDVILARSKPVFMGRVKINLYVYAILSMMLGNICDSMFLMNLANVLVALGICAGGIAFGIYMMRWSKELHPLS
jgi:cardiolipin synthase